jgi:hypothetical protein
MLRVLGLTAIAILCLWGVCAMVLLGMLALDERRYRRWKRRQHPSDE